MTHLISERIGLLHAAQGLHVTHYVINTPLADSLTFIGFCGFIIGEGGFELAQSVIVVTE